MVVGVDSVFMYSVKYLFKVESLQLSKNKYGPENSVLSVYEDQQETSGRAVWKVYI